MSARERAREGEGERARRRSNAPSYECGVGKAPRSESSDAVQSCAVCQNGTAVLRSYSNSVFLLTLGGPLPGITLVSDSVDRACRVTLCVCERALRLAGAPAAKTRTQRLVYNQWDGTGLWGG